MRTLTKVDLEIEKNARSCVLRLMLDYRWHTTTEINQVAAGTEGTRRLRELRQPPNNLKIERCQVLGSRQWQYRLVQEQPADGTNDPIPTNTTETP